MAEPLKEQGLAIDWWQGRKPRKRRALLTRSLLQRALRLHAADSIDFAENHQYFLPYGDWASGPSARNPENSLSHQDVNAVALLGLSIMDELVDKATGCPSSADAAKAKLLTAFESTSSSALVMALVCIADNLARNNWRVETIPAVYRYAIEVAPRPNLLNELGVILLERAGIAEDALWDSDGSTVVFSAREFGGAEIRDLDQEDGPMMPEHSSRLVQLAADAFARAYGYYALDLSLDERSTLDVYHQTSCALDGLRVVAQELGLNDLQRSIYLEYWTFYEMGPGPTEFRSDSWGRDFAPRFAYSLGLSRGLARAHESRDAVLEASRVLDAPLRPGLVDEIRKAVAKEIRSAPVDQLVEATTRAAEMAGPAWAELPTKVRDDLAQAECMQGITYPPSFNWAPVALLYCFAIERLLCETFASELKKFLSEKDINEQVFLSEHSLKFENGLSKGMIGEFVFLMKRCIEDPRIGDFMARTPLGHVGRLRDIGGRINGFNQKYRRMTAHPGEAISGAAVRDVKRWVYESPNGPAESLLSLLANLRMQPPPAVRGA